MTSFRPSDLEAYLDEALPPEEMARIEKAARDDKALVRQLASIHARRSAGVHSLGEIWRQHRLSGAAREQWGGYLLGTLTADHAEYLTFHLQVVGCRYCQANLADLQSQHADAEPIVHRRRSRYFQSSAGYLRRGERKRTE
jgi:hypothetical protein